MLLRNLSESRSSVSMVGDMWEQLEYENNTRIGDDF
jgi:hypothetical protein